MASSRCIKPFLRTSLGRSHGDLSRTSLLTRAGFSTTCPSWVQANAAYVQKPDKTHPTPTNTLAPAKASQVALASKGKGNARLKASPDDEKLQTNEQQLRQLETLTVMEGKAPFDVWAHPVETFDLHIPTWRSPRKDASILDHCRAIWSTQANWFRNAINMRTIASKQSFPGVRVKSLWSRDLFRVQSTPWLAPFREIALVSYKQLNQALAAGDDKTIKKLSAVSYQDHLLKVLRTQDLTKKYAWTFHGEKEPCKVVSIRAFPAHMGKEDPTFGSRLLIQALVRFDTLQSLQVYSRKGTLLAGDGKPKHVVEYLVFQKRMWYDTPWVIRDQLFDSLEGKYKMSN